MKAASSRVPIRVLGFALAGFAALPAVAASGRVQDPAGHPIRGARACVMLAPDATGLCVETDDNGLFTLPGAQGTAVRILAEGFLSVDVGAVDHTTPIRLERAAAFEIRVVDDVDGTAVASASLWVVSPNGQRRGPVDLGASGWLRMKTFPPGTYRVLAVAPGYLDGVGDDLRLQAGQTTSAVIRLRRDPASGSSR